MDQQVGLAAPQACDCGQCGMTELGHLELCGRGPLHPPREQAPGEMRSC